MLLSVSANLKHAAMLKRLGYDALDVDLCNVIYSGSLHDILKADGYDVCYCLNTTGGALCSTGGFFA